MNLGTKNNKKGKNGTNKKATDLKLLSIGSVIILLVIVITSNILFDKLLGGPLTFDFSSTGKNSVCKATEEVIDKIPDGSQIRIVGLFDKPASLEGDVIMQCIIPLLETYEKYGGSKLKVEYINPNTYPSILKELDPTDSHGLQKGIFAVKNGEKLAVIDPYSCFTYDYSYYGYDNAALLTANLVEFTFTNTINNLLSDKMKHAYFVTGLQEDNSAQMKSILTSLGCESGGIASSENFVIPEDCDILFLNGINTDISESVQLRLKEYIAKGGKLVVTVNYYANAQEKYEKLNSVLSDVNLTIDNYLIDENDPSYVLSSDYFESYVDIADEFKGFTEKNQLHCSFARPVRICDAPKDYISTYAVLSTSDKATVQTADDGYLNYVNEGKYNVGMYATYNDGTANPEVFVFGTTNLTSDSYISAYGFSDDNVEFIKGCIRKMLSVAPEETINIPSYELEDHSIDKDRATSTSITVMSLVFVAVIPLIMIICATVVYNRRKHL